MVALAVHRHVRRDRDRVRPRERDLTEHLATPDRPGGDEQSHCREAGGVGVPFVLGLALAILAVSALLARAGVSRPEVDVVQFVVRWRNRESELAPISIGASFLQFTLGIVTIPAVKLLPPSVLYQPQIAASAKTTLVTLAVSITLVGLAYLVWSGRAGLHAPAEQQREAEEKS